MHTYFKYIHTYMYIHTIYKARLPILLLLAITITIIAISRHFGSGACRVPGPGRPEQGWRRRDVQGARGPVDLSKAGDAETFERLCATGSEHGDIGADLDGAPGGPFKPNIDIVMLAAPSRSSPGFIDVKQESEEEFEIIGERVESALHALASAPGYEIGIKERKQKKNNITHIVASLLAVPFENG